MKTLLSKSFFAAALIALCSAGAVAQGTQTLNETFATGPGNWMAGQSSNSSYTTAGGHLTCTMGLQGNNTYRGDLWYNYSSVAANDLSFNPTTDVYLAVKFIGNRPNGAMKLEMQRVNADNSLGWYNTQWNSVNPEGSVTTSGNNKIYWFRLTKDAAYAAATAPVTIRRIHFVIADAAVAPFSYTVDWVATFATLADLEAYKDTQDDGPTDSDEANVDPSTIAGYFNYPFTADANDWRASIAQKVFRNNDKLIVKNTAAQDLQAKRLGVVMNSTNFPYVAVKVDALPAGFNLSTFKIQTNCAALSIYDSWYSVIEQKGDVYIFDMTTAVHKVSGASQAAVATTNPVDMWIDFGAIAANEVAQIGWVKTYQTLAEIPTETAAPLLAETSETAGVVAYEFNDDHASTTSWDWRTAHWQDGESGCKVSSENGMLTLTPNTPDPLVAAYTRNPQAMNSNNFPYFAIKVSEMGDAGYFKLSLNSISKGNFVINNTDPSVTVLGTNSDIYVFDLSNYLMFNTATDVQMRMDFYQGTSGTVNATSTVEIDWIRSYVSTSDIVDVITARPTATIADGLKIYSGNGVLNIVAAEAQELTVYAVDGRVVKQSVKLDAGANTISLNRGIYIIEKQKAIVW